MAVWWTKTSSPFSRLKNPNPLASLNHLTVPVSIVCFVPLLLIYRERNVEVLRAER
jgi:hypothetical protein